MNNNFLVEIESNPIYKEALDRGRIYLENPEGITSYKAPSESDKIIIRQNNTIILLLLSLHNKIEKIENTNLEKQKGKDYSKDLENIIWQLDNIKITEKGESFKKNRGRTSSNIFGVAYKIDNKGKVEEK